MLTIWILKYSMFKFLFLTFDRLFHLFLIIMMNARSSKSSQESAWPVNIHKAQTVNEGIFLYVLIHTPLTFLFVEKVTWKDVTKHKQGTENCNNSKILLIVGNFLIQCFSNTMTRQHVTKNTCNTVYLPLVIDWEINENELLM